MTILYGWEVSSPEDQDGGVQVLSSVRKDPYWIGNHFNLSEVDEATFSEGQVVCLAGLLAPLGIYVMKVGRTQPKNVVSVAIRILLQLCISRFFLDISLSSVDVH